MAVVSSHILNSVDGSHAGGIPARLTNLSRNTIVAESQSDGGGRLLLDVDLSTAKPDDRYELTLFPKVYWEEQSGNLDHLIDEIVLRFEMPAPNTRYHLPIILSPHGYSTWKSVPETLDD